MLFFSFLQLLLRDFVVKNEKIYQKKREFRTVFQAGFLAKNLRSG
jgi:hypothetical protein